MLAIAKIGKIAVCRYNFEKLCLTLRHIRGATPSLSQIGLIKWPTNFAMQYGGKRLPESLPSRGDIEGL